MHKIFRGSSPTNDGSTLTTLDKPPEGYAIPELPERPEEFSPGLTPELMELVEEISRLT